MGYRKDDIERLKESLAGLPQLANLEVSKQEAVRLLAPTIRALQAKGYRLDRIAALVSEHGVTITPTTLKSYLHRVKPRGKPPAKTGRKSPATYRETLGEDAHAQAKTTPPARQPEVDRVRAGGTKVSLVGAVTVAAQDEARDTPSAAAEPVVTARPLAHRGTSPVTPTTRPVDTTKASFTPRDDSDDI